jgi:hypothetical protein
MTPSKDGRAIAVWNWFASRVTLSREDRMRIRVVSLFAVTLALVTARPWNMAAAGGGHSFLIYDNMFYRGKPNTARDGLVTSNILYENKIWPSKAGYGVLPSHAAFAALVRGYIANPGPLVIDIEDLPLKGPTDVARRNMQTLATLADWSREAAPGKVIGFYGTNTLSRVPLANLPLARELARHVDAFFPPMYTFDDDRAGWEKRAQETVAEARELDPQKPIYFYLWPQYHDGTPKAFQYIDAEYWGFQLGTSYRHSSGIVLWSRSKDDWNDSTGWWSATVQFARELNRVR